MTEKEFLQHLLKELSKARTRLDVRELIKKADESLDEAQFTKSAKRAFFGELIQEAQDNSATMSNAGTAQEIVNQILNENR